MVPEACARNGVMILAASAYAPGGKTVLGKISVQPGYQGAPERTTTGPWQYFQKRPVRIRAGTPQVTVSLPASWRGRAALALGNSAMDGRVLLRSCSQRYGKWDVYPGGLYLRSVAACVPLTFSIGDRQATVDYSTGRGCRS